MKAARTELFQLQLFSAQNDFTKCTVSSHRKTQPNPLEL